MLLLLASCAADNSPKAYGAEARANFMEGCTGAVTARAEAEGVEQIDLGTEATCGCVYDQLAEAVPFAEFEEIDGAIEDDPTRVPAEVQLAFDRCVAGPVAPASTTVPPTTTAAP
jgi:hypothetical protein